MTIVLQFSDAHIHFEKVVDSVAFDNGNWQDEARLGFQVLNVDGNDGTRVGQVLVGLSSGDLDIGDKTLTFFGRSKHHNMEVK